MKTFRLLGFIFLIFIFSGGSINAQSEQSVSDYMSTINDEFEVISKELWGYVKAVAKGRGARKVEKKRQELIASVDAAKYKFKRIKGFQGDTRLRDALVANLSLSGIVLKEEYGRIMDLEEIAEQSYDLMEAYILAKEVAGFKLDSANEVLEREQEIFAKDHKINFVDNKSKRSEKIKQANEVIGYYNKVYLVFFKSYKQEMYMLEAASAGDLSAFEQNRESLISISEEGKTRLKEIGDYNNDKSLRYLCHEILNFYSDEAQNKMTVVSDLYLKQENVEKLQSAYESKRKNERTKEDADKVNEAINDYNQAINKYNAVNESVNKSRSDIIDKWNKTVDKFLSQHAI